MSINGASSTSLWIPWANLSNGANLVFNLGSTANTSWGAGATDAPPSLGSVSAATNYARAATVSASSVSGTNLASNATDTVTSTRWQSAGDAGDKWLSLDLGATYSIDHWIVMHAGEVGERTTCDTKNFKLQKSTDGSIWTDVDAVTGNTANITDRVVRPFGARYVRLYIMAPTQGTDTIARIYELQVYGRNTSAVIASSEFNASQAALMAVDDSTSTKWCSANSDTGDKWLKMDLERVAIG